MCLGASVMFLAGCTSGGQNDEVASSESATPSETTVSTPELIAPGVQDGAREVVARGPSSERAWVSESFTAPPGVVWIGLHCQSADQDAVVTTDVLGTSIDNTCSKNNLHQIVLVKKHTAQLKITADPGAVWIVSIQTGPASESDQAS